MEKRRDLGMIPIPAHRRRRIRPLIALGVIAIAIGLVMGWDIVWSMGAGLVIFSLIALWVDRRTRGRESA